ncbi:hypothetical protein MK786_10105 [Microbacterium sp. CFH 31415]|uniref:hypothetical protein n=1 Tax=Microbacterium sp. CFH 31415 TaxID=2921732 RepID=UPI001F142D98|nr:hypothetical protein [Microbacterium sp. CFH 31415]MCH6231089.1 hypothetical protein [Microbacterium sp. CFH 31415]
MSDPTPPPSDDATPADAQPTPASDAQPTEAYGAQPTEVYGAPADAQPTQAYPPADAQPTQAYPPADAQPTAVYPPAYGQPTAGQPAPGQPYGHPSDPAVYGGAAYGQPAYGQPAYAAPAPADLAARPRTLGWVSLGLAIGGLVLVGAAYLPLAWVSLVLAMIGGLLLLAALVFGIVTLASKKQGAKGLGIGAIAVSVLGGLAWIGAITLAFVWIGLAAVGSDSAGGLDPAPTVSESAPVEDGSDEGTEGEATGTYDEAAYLAAVRPEILAIMQEIEPSITEEVTAQFYTDEMLISIGQSTLVMGDAGVEAAIDGIVEGSDGMFGEEQATRFITTIYDAAQQHLVE